MRRFTVVAAAVLFSATASAECSFGDEACVRSENGQLRAKIYELEQQVRESQRATESTNIDLGARLKAQFFEGCMPSARGNERGCQCIWDGVNRTLTVGEFLQMNTIAQANGDLTLLPSWPRYTRILQVCGTR